MEQPHDCVPTELRLETTLSILKVNAIDPLVNETICFLKGFTTFTPGRRTLTLHFGCGDSNHFATRLNQEVDLRF